MTNPDSSAAAASAANASILPNAHLDTASPWPVFGVASVAVFLVSMDGTMLFAAFSALRAGFPQATAADLSWVLNAYTHAPVQCSSPIEQCRRRGGHASSDSGACIPPNSKRLTGLR